MTKERILTLKVQRPLHSTDPTRPWLFYDDGQRTYFTIPEADVPAPVVAAMGTHLKIFIRAVLGPKNAVDLRGRAEPQPW